MSLFYAFLCDFAAPVYTYGNGTRCKCNPAHVGENMDAWGSVWYVGEPGVFGEVKEIPLADWSSLNSYKLLWELIDCNLIERYIY